MPAITYGFEREFFVTNKEGEYVRAGSLPQDGCGYLAEVRGEWSPDPRKALFLYLYQEDMVTKQAEKLGLTLKLESGVVLPAKFKQECLRSFGKNPSDNEGMMYGKAMPLGNISRAGLHIHFGSVHKVFDKDGVVREYSATIDMPRFIYALDKAFEKEIREAKRTMGLYKMKPHGFEYRSLPANVDMVKVVNVLILLQQHAVLNADVQKRLMGV